MKCCKRGKEQSKVVLSHIQICVLPKEKTQQVVVGGGRETGRKTKTEGANMSASPSFKDAATKVRCSPFTVGHVSLESQTCFQGYCTFEVEQSQRRL